MRRAGRLYATGELLRIMFDLPEDINIRDIRVDHLRDMIDILLEDGESLPEIPEGAEPPFIDIKDIKVNQR